MLFIYLFVYLFIYLLQLGFRPVAVVGMFIQKYERDSTKGETIHKNIRKQNTKKKIENKYTQQQKT